MIGPVNLEFRIFDADQDGNLFDMDGDGAGGKARLVDSDRPLPSYSGELSGALLLDAEL